MEVQDIDYGIEEPPPFGANLPKDKLEELKELFEDFKSRKDELKELVRGGHEILIAALIVGLASILGVLVMVIALILK